MINLSRIGALSLSVLAFSAAYAAEDTHDHDNEDSEKALAVLRNVDGEIIGTVNMQDGNAGVLMHVEIEGIAPGGHAIHIHATGSCEPDFKASHGHINLHEHQHGLLNPDGPDNGDLPNIYAHSDGSVRAELLAVGVAVSHAYAEKRGVAELLDEDGSAIVVHESPDDHTTQPIGGAGGRIACGVVHAM
ncbi:MAG: superoxide dismutase family protein [Albidovulum sp.]|nr:superoxide dismutase family protein [Albidovulum sp.]